MTVSQNCSEDGCPKNVDREGLCFRHRVSGVGFNFVGGGSYGRKAFHDNTAAEVCAQTEARAKSLGIDAQKISTRQELV